LKAEAYMSERTTNKETPANVQRAPELWYGYYRRCHHFLKNGRQCKAPALKGGTLCYRHDAQAAIAARHERSVRQLGLPERLVDPRNRLEALSRIMHGLLTGKIDQRTAGRLLVKVQGA
jgi:hypothetical protein